MSIPPQLIRIPDPTNGRLAPSPERVTVLAENIAQLGLLNAITVRSNGETYDLVAGLGRLLAIRQLGWAAVPIRLLGGTNADAALARLSENVTRSNLSPLEEATQLHELVETHPEGTIGVARQLGRSQGWVEDRLDMLTWPPDLMEHVHGKRISLAAAKHLARISDPTTQTMYIRDAAANGISARTADLWRREAAGTCVPDLETAENSVHSGRALVQTEIRVTCFGCNEPHKIEDTLAARLCTGCRMQIDAAQSEARESDQHHTPPPH